MTMRLRSVMAVLLGFGALSSPVQADEWRSVDPDNLVVMDLTYGRVLIELAPFTAPEHAKRFRALVRDKFYDGQSFYRVIDGFVAQGGAGEDEDEDAKPDPNAPPPKWANLKAEFDRKIDDDVTFTPL